jgi:malate dehydrogenase
MQKVVIVGAGRVGETAAQLLAQRETASEVVPIDIREDAPQGVALDIAQMAPFFYFDTKVTGSNDPAAMHDADLVVTAAGVPGMSRSDVLDTNAKVVDGIVDDIVRYAPQAMIVMVTNPVDVSCLAPHRLAAKPRVRSGRGVGRLAHGGGHCGRDQFRHARYHHHRAWQAWRQHGAGATLLHHQRDPGE